MSEGVRRSPATWLLLVLTAGLAGALALSASLSVATAAGWRAVDADPTTQARAAALGVFDDAGLRQTEGLAALLTVPAAAVALLVLVGLLSWRPWAREAALGVFGLPGSLVCLFALASLAQGTGSAGKGLAFGLVLVVTAALAVSRPVCRDFDHKRVAGEVEERLRRQEQRRRSEAA